ncbi:MAG: hypothetical protein WA945_10305, partial [Arcobacteraceae bacterium]
MDGITIGLISAGAISLMYGDWFTKEKFGFRCNRFAATSSLNPARQTDGLKWTTTRALERVYPKSKEIDEENQTFLFGFFRYAPSMEKCKIPWWWRKYQEKTGVYLDRESMITSTLAYGGMKSSKTVFFLNLLENTQAYD